MHIISSDMYIVSTHVLLITITLFISMHNYIIETAMYDNGITLFLDLSMIPDACFL